MKTLRVVLACCVLFLSFVGRSHATMLASYAVYLNSVLNSDNSITLTATLQGSASIGSTSTCQQMNPPQYYHRPHLQVGLSTGNGEGEMVAPCAYINISASDLQSAACTTTSAGCNVNVYATVYCSLLGALIYSFLNPVRTETAWTTVAGGAPYTSCFTIFNGPPLCHFPVNNWCTAATSPPDANYNGGTYNASKDTLLPFFALIKNSCVRWWPGPWLCGLGLGAIFQEGGPYIPLQPCTHNP